MTTAIRRVRNLLFAVLTIGLLAGCEDPRRLSWAPDGKTAIVLAGDGARLMDGNGNLGDPISGVALTSWFANSQQLLLVEHQSVETWSEVQKLERPDELRRVEATARKMVTEAKLSRGDWKTFEKSVNKLPHAAEAVLYLKENKDKEMAVFGEEWTKIKKMVDVSVNHICLYQVSGKTLSQRKQVLTTMRDVRDVRVAPNGKSFLLVEKPEGDEDIPYTLLLVDMGTGNRSIVSGAASMYPDWSSDGKRIYYIEAELPAAAFENADLEKTALIGSLQFRTVDLDGNKLDSSPATIVARLIFAEHARVRAMQDGNVIFTAYPVSFPGSFSQLIVKQNLFQVCPDKSVLVSPVLPTGIANDGDHVMEFFEVSPNGKFISIPSNKDGIDVYSSLTGVATRIDPNDFAWSKRMPFIPSWRNDDELCLPLKTKKPAVASEDGPIKPEEVEKTDVVLYSMSKETAKSLSHDWPASAKKRFLE